MVCDLCAFDPLFYGDAGAFIRCPALPSRVQLTASSLVDCAASSTVS
jgi:hypothetical protein